MKIAAVALSASENDVSVRKEAKARLKEFIFEGNRESVVDDLQKGSPSPSIPHRVRDPSRIVNASLDIASLEIRPELREDISLLCTAALCHRLVKRGISSQIVNPLSDYLGIGKGTLAEHLELDRGTLHRRAQANLPLPSHAAESVLRLLVLDQIANDTFATEEDAIGWLRKPHPMLDGETPLESARTSFGTERVKEILTSLKWGGVV